jgi:hypothetical protein
MAAPYVAPLIHSLTAISSELDSIQADLARLQVGAGVGHE